MEFSIFQNSPLSWSEVCAQASVYEIWCMYRLLIWKNLLLRALFSEDCAPSEMMCYPQLFIAKVYKLRCYILQLVDCSMKVGHYLSTRAGCLTLLLWIYRMQRQWAKQPNLTSNLLHTTQINTEVKAYALCFVSLATFEQLKNCTTTFY